MGQVACNTKLFSLGKGKRVKTGTICSPSKGEHRGV